MAFNYDAPNKPASPIVAPADPNVEGVGSGMNAASNMCGIGIASAVADPKASDWPRIAIDPAPGQYLGWGGDSVATGQEDADIPPLKVVDYEGADFNDTFAFVAATAGGTTKGDTIATGYVLASDVTVGIGDWIWAKTAVA